jgi:hypothetical protein
VATPTMEERRTMAKSGVAMPDGSYYIRNAGELTDAISAVGRATPNAGESDVARRNSVRRHIIKRARALNLESMIPDTWNSDGSLKQSGIDELMDQLMDEVDEFLEHFGVKGMRWGVRRAHPTGARGPSDHQGPAGSKSAPAAPALSKHQVKKAAKKAAQIKNVDDQIVAMNENLDILRHNLKIMEGHLAKHGKAGRTIADPDVREAVSLTAELSLNVKQQEREIARMKKIRASLSHADEVDDFLEHYGVKGMRWGVRRRHPGSSSSGRPSGPVSSDAARAARLKTRVSQHGTQSLTNAELQTLVTRLNLETQHGRLDPKKVNAGQAFVTDVGKNIAKQEAANLVSQYGRKGAAWLAGVAAAKVSGMIIKKVVAG